MYSRMKEKDPRAEFERTLTMFRTWLTGRGLTKGYVDALVKAVRVGFSDPAGHAGSLQSSKAFINTRQAWIHWGDWTGNDEPSRLVKRLRGPRALPPAPRVLPTDHELRACAEAAAATPLPHGPLLWILYLSGLRIAEVCHVQRLEAEEALRKAEVTIRQKGVGGLARRTWVPGCLVRPALRALLVLPWRYTGVLISASADAPDQQLRSRVTGGFHPHDFRHAIARLLRRLGHQDSLIGAVLGHDHAQGPQLAV